MVLSTKGSNGDAYTIRMANAFQPSVVVRDVLSCRTWTVFDSGELELDMDKGEPRVLFPEASMSGSGLCGYGREKVQYLDLVSRSDSPVIEEKVSGEGLSYQAREGGLRSIWGVLGLILFTVYY